jgi:hypothetical protein
MTSKIQRIRAALLELEIQPATAMKVVDGGTGLSHDFNVLPEDFLDQAEEDLESGGNAAILNCLTNANRAIHSQVDQALEALHLNNGGLSWKKKLVLFADVGFIAPRILKKVSDKRNLLEHQYKAPSKRAVGEALDLSTLFVASTKRHLDMFEGDFVIGNPDKRLDAFSFEKEMSVGFSTYSKKAPRFTLWFRKGMALDEPSPRNKRILEVEIGPSETLYKDLVRLALAGERENKVLRALTRFFQTLNARI